MSEEKSLLLKLHPCAFGLDDEAINEIAQAAELVRCDAGDIICQTEDVLDSVYLIVHGRLRVSAYDSRGRLVMQRFHSAGSQFGGVGASLAEPLPLECRSEDPSVLLRFHYDVAFDLTKKFDTFRTNVSRMIASSVREALFNERSTRAPALIAFFHQSDETRVIRNQVLRRLIGLEETVTLLTDQLTDLSGVRQLPRIGSDDELGPEELRQVVAQTIQTGRAIADIRSNFDPERASRTLLSCEQIFWCVTPTNWEASLTHLRRLESTAPTWRDKIHLVWLLQPEEETPTANELRSLCNRDFKIRFDSQKSNHGPALTTGLDRLIQFLRGVQIGVALGGGAARGMAHLGVLNALQREGIAVDMIAGTSAGAMTGTLYASGFDPTYLVQRFKADLKPSWCFRCLPHGDQWHLLYKYRRRHFDPMLRRYLGDTHIEQLAIPMHLITVDLIKGQAVIREKGDAVQSIVESINLPVLSPPITRHGEALVDGGLINNVPADVLASKGCNFVIAVSVTAKMEMEFAHNRPDTPAERMRSASAIQTLLRSYLVQSHSVNSIGVQPADYVIEPDVRGFELTDFARTDELSAIGEQATMDAIPEIRELLHRLDPKLYPVLEKQGSL